MVILLNLLPLAVFFLGVYLAVKFKSVKIMVVAVVIEVVLLFVQPSYLPKGEVRRSAVPDFEVSSSAIEDRQLKPQDGAEYDSRREAEIVEGLPFLQAK